MPAFPDTVIAGPSISSGSAPKSSFLQSITAPQAPAKAPPETVKPASAEPALPVAAPEPKPEKAVKSKAPVSEKPTKTETHKSALDAMLATFNEDEPAKSAEPAAEEPSDGKDDKDFGELPANATPEAKVRWGEVKHEAKMVPALKKELEATKVALEEAKKVQNADPIKRELEELRTKLAAQEGDMALTHVERTSAFKRDVTTPLLAANKEVASLATRSKVSESRIFAALSESDEEKRETALTEIADELSERDKVRLWNLDDRVGTINARRAEIEANAEVALAEALSQEKQNTEKSKNETKAAEMRAVATTVEKLKPMAKFFTGEGESADAVISSIAQSAQATPFSELSTDEKAWAAIAAVAIPRMQNVLSSREKEIASLKQELESLSGAGASPGKGSQTSEQVKDNRSFAQRMGWNS